MTQTAREYGSALFDLAAELHREDDYMQQLSAIRTALERDPEYLRLLASRALPEDQRLAALDQVFAKRAEPYILNFMKLLCRRHLIGELPLCIRAFELRYFELRGISEVLAQTAKELPEDLRRRLQDRLEKVTGKQIRLKCSVDPSVLGGVRLTMDGRELDGTVRSRLEDIRARLSQLTL